MKSWWVSTLDKVIFEKIEEHSINMALSDGRSAITGVTFITNPHARAHVFAPPFRTFIFLQWSRLPHIPIELVPRIRHLEHGR